ncbi:hypothetical protein PMAYCL1PPCAC_05482, partial [Pristionchus mayeri]
NNNNNNKTCEDCEFVAASPAALIIHKRRHTGERPFECSGNGTCTMTFVTKGNLDRHIRFVHQSQICKQAH